MGKVVMDVPPEKPPQEISEQASPGLYDAVFSAEFRSRRDQKTPFIRTRFAPPEGSSAYGPLQITKGLMVNAMDQLDLTEKEEDYVDRFIEQADKFLKFGKEPDKEGYRERYDYGGEGDLTSLEDRRLYRSVGKKLLNLVWDQSGGDSDKFIKAWRYGPGSEKEVARDDPDYYKAFTNTMQKGAA